VLAKIILQIILKYSNHVTHECIDNIWTIFYEYKYIYEILQIYIYLQLEILLKSHSYMHKENCIYKLIIPMV
jgi:hypothetical protein